MNLVQLLLLEPLVAVDPDAARTFHAVTAAGVPAADWPNVVFTSACGIEGVRLVEDADSEGAPTLWPVQHRLPSGWARCRACWVATGQRRPRTHAEVVPNPFSRVQGA